MFESFARVAARLRHSVQLVVMSAVIVGAMGGTHSAEAVDMICRIYTVAGTGAVLQAPAYAAFDLPLLVTGADAVDRPRVFHVAYENAELGLGVSMPALSAGDGMLPGSIFNARIPALPPGTYPVRLQEYGVESCSKRASVVVGPAAATISVASLLFAEKMDARDLVVPGIRYFLTATASDLPLLLSQNTPSPDATFFYPIWRLADAGFKAWPASGDAPTAALPVCRFFSPQYSTHFYSAKPEECALLRSLPTQWNDEGTAFRALLPDEGVCGYGTEPVYRLFSAEFKNHRYTTKADTYRAMRLAGWVGEGAAFCSPLN